MYRRSSNNKKLNPWYITGYSDGDSSFWFSIIPNNKLKVNFEIRPGYSIIAAINPANYELMLLLDEYFCGIGSILTDNKTKMYEYRIQGFKNCLIVKNHFLSYPLMTYRLVYFTMWCDMLDLIKNKSHITIEGLNKLVNIKASFPRGLTNNLKENFPQAHPVNLPDYEPVLSNLNYYWLSGFINTDGSFFFSLTLGVTAKISIGQHTKSLVLLETITQFLGFGSISKIKTLESHSEVREIIISRLSSIIALTEKLSGEHRLYGAKYWDFLDFCRGIEIIKSKKHLTETGLSDLKKIYSGMNQRRKEFK